MWFDDLKGYQFNKKNAEKIAKWIDGVVHHTDGGTFVMVPTSRGDMMVREGDWVAKDARGQTRLVRITEPDISKDKSKVSPADLAKKGK